jgi:hypothetical protein
MPTLEDTGVSYNQSAQPQRLAALPTDQFEPALSMSLHDVANVRPQSTASVDIPRSPCG